MTHGTASALSLALPRWEDAEVCDQNQRRARVVAKKALAVSLLLVVPACHVAAAGPAVAQAPGEAQKKVLIIHSLRRDAPYTTLVEQAFRKTLSALVRRIARHINIPFTVGGGISSVEDVSILLENGADKISVNTSAYKNPQLINSLSKEFGSQCVVLAIDTKIEK